MSDMSPWLMLRARTPAIAAHQEGNREEGGEAKGG